MCNLKEIKMGFVNGIRIIRIVNLLLMRLAVICPGIEYTQGKNLICLSDGHEEKTRLISAL